MNVDSLWKPRTVWLFMGLLTLFLIGYPFDNVQAHGGGTPQLTNVQAGPYLLSLWTEPDPIQVGEAHFTVALAEPEGANEPVLGADVKLRFQSIVDSNQRFSATATHEAALNKLYYEVDLDLPVEGHWEVDVLIDGPLGSGGTTFEIEVVPASNFKWILSGVGVLLLVGGWFAMRSRD